MKKIFFVSLLVVVLALSLVGCVGTGTGQTKPHDEYILSVKEDISLTLTVGDEVDFTEFFTLENSEGEQLLVTEEMLDLSKVNLAIPGVFQVTLSYKGQSCTATFTVLPQGGGQGGQGGEEPPVEEGKLSEVLSRYDDYDKWNFEISFKVDCDGEEAWNYLYGFMGDDFFMSYPDEEGNTYTDYIIYDEDGYVTYYGDMGDGTYLKMDEDHEEFYLWMMYVDYFELTELGSFTFTEQANGRFDAADPHATGNSVFGEFEDNTWTSFSLFVKDGKIVRITATADAIEEGENYTYTYDINFSRYGAVSFSVNNLPLYEEDNGGSGNDTPENPPVVGGSTTIFLDKDLSSDGGLDFSSTGIPNSFDSNRGVQYLQAGGDVELSAGPLSGVSAVSVVVATNCPTGMTVRVYVGNTALTVNGEAEVTVQKQSTFTELTTLTFTTSTPVDGTLKVVLGATATSKSMYIHTIVVNASGAGGNEGGNGDVSGSVMEEQVYDPDKVDGERLQDKLMEVDFAIGLPSVGDYHCLVVPIKFSDTTITSADLAKLNLAFNGDSSSTGWESVSSYYRKASYGQLNMTFDIADVFVANGTSDYYNNYYRTFQDADGYTYYETGDTLLLLQVLAYLEDKMDLTQYDTNGDGCLDAIYLVYSADVEYEDDDSIYWAYTTYYVSSEEENQTFDGKDVYYYFFAGFDFMDEDVEGGYEVTGTIPGLEINAATYIHETGHLLGMDDYYDYYPGEGADEGLGGADMMDSTVGDHNAYTKMMMGWIDPIVVTEDATISIESLAASGEFLMILLDYNGSYFSEYLIIDLYAATGLNELHAGAKISYLYDGAAYGVRIYHVSSSAENPFDNDMVSFTDYNNSTSDIALIKLLEADGTSQFSDTDGWASDDDLWQTGDKLSDAFPTYKRNDGALLSFDIIIEYADAQGAVITIDFE